LADGVSQPGKLSLEGKLGKTKDTASTRHDETKLVETRVSFD